MTSLLYLWSRRLKNQFITFLKSPGKLILTIIFIALFVFVVWTGTMQDAGVVAKRDVRELYGIILILYAWVFIPILYNGLNKGATFFKMGDVNLLFPAPISSTKLLIYGLGQQLNNSLLMGFFLIYQYSWLHNLYNVSVGGLIVILLGYTLTLFFAQLCAMTAYALTSVDAPGQEGRKRRMVRIAIPVVILAFLAQPLLSLLNHQGNLMPTLLNASGSAPIQWFPIVGWLRMAVIRALEGQLLPSLGWLALTIAFAALLVGLLVKSQADYYEDVLQASEVAHIRQEKSKQGTQHDTRKIKAGQTGLSRGTGASALYFKHRVENRRERIFLLEKNSWIFLLASFGFGFLMREESMYPAMAFAVYMQMFGTSTGRWVRELMLPYVYLIPETPFRKLWFCLSQSFEKMALESIILWIPLGLVLKLSPLNIALCALCYLSFGMIFIASNLLIERLWGHVLIKWLIVSLYFVVSILLVLPGIITGIVLTSMGLVLLSVETTVLLSMFLINLALALLLLFCCRNVLARAELNQLQGE